MDDNNGQLQNRGDGGGGDLPMDNQVDGFNPPREDGNRDRQHGRNGRPLQDFRPRRANAVRNEQNEPGAGNNRPAEGNAQNENNNNNNNNNNNDAAGGNNEENAAMAGEGRDDVVIEGGIAGAPPGREGEGGNDNASSLKSSDCDLVILIECAERIQKNSSSIGYRVGSVVSIGLFERNTQMETLFKRYVAICSRSGDTLPLSSVEFVHNDVLPLRETAEQCALMKGDKIRVRRKRTKERGEAEQRKKMQRESDRDFLNQLRSMFYDNRRFYENNRSNLDIFGPKVVLQCGPSLLENESYVLNQNIRIYESIASQRCKWLKDKIAKAKEIREQSRRNHPQEVHQPGGQVVFTIPQERETSLGTESDTPTSSRRYSGSLSDGHSGSRSPVVGTGLSRGVSRAAEDDDDEDAVVHYEPMQDQQNRPNGDIQPAEVRAIQQPSSVENHDQRAQVEEGRGAQNFYVFNGPHHQVVAEDEDEGETVVMGASNNALYSNSQNGRGVQDEDLLFVPLRDHPPEAVELLMEYCHTNRVICLGKESFVQSSKGAVPPHFSVSNKWPNLGNPTLPMSVALAGISLAEEAGMPRLSLMCEIAASNIITSSNVLDALALCTNQTAQTGNRLPILRKKAMEHLVSTPVLKELSHTRKFLVGLKEQRNLVVPALLEGTRDIDLPPKNKRKSSTGQFSTFSKKVDDEDKEARNLERTQRRMERHVQEFSLVWNKL